MSSATVIENSTRLSAIDRLFFRFESLLNLAGGIAIFLLVLLATTNV
ncbi:MAG: TRAP transporter small permease, partial [Gammaproteobacteria bacterium]|nr:TRAP transporter small permease [Gammaproteobacteria bacterium]